MMDDANDELLIRLLLANGLEECDDAVARIQTLKAERDRFAERHERHLVLGAEVRARAEKAEAAAQAAQIEALEADRSKDHRFIKELCDQIEQLNAKVADWSVRAEAAEAKLAVAVGALEFYGKWETWEIQDPDEGFTELDQDEGKKARAALAQIKGDE